MIKVLGIAGFLLLASCSTLQQGATALGCSATGGVTPAQQLACFVKKAQEATVQVCGFLPTIATVTGILGVGISDAFMIAAQICAVVQPAPGARVAVAPSGAYGSVHGVPVKGSFVGRR